jgi:hypothetical protein
MRFIVASWRWWGQDAAARQHSIVVSGALVEGGDRRGVVEHRERERNEVRGRNGDGKGLVIGLTGAAEVVLADQKW